MPITEIFDRPERFAGSLRSLFALASSALLLVALAGYTTIVNLPPEAEEGTWEEASMAEELGREGGLTRLEGTVREKLGLAAEE